MGTPFSLVVRSLPGHPDMTAAWKKQKEQGSAILVRLICWIAIYLGRGVARAILLPIDLYFLLRLPNQRQASRQYLERILDRKVNWLDTARHIHCFAATILDRVYFLTGQFERFDIRIHSKDTLMRYVEAGKGCILLGSHLGSFEVLRALGVTEKQLNIKIVMDKAHNTRITSVLDQLNPRISDTVLILDDAGSILQLHKLIEQGGLVGLLGDRVFSSNSKTVTTRFLGDDIEIPADPYLLAHLLKVPVILFFGLYYGKNRYDIHFELLADSIELPRKNRLQVAGEWAQKYTDRLSHYAHKAPYNWFNFYPYWKK